MGRASHAPALLASAVGLSLFFSAWADIDPRTGRAGGDVGPQSFAEYCAGELPAQRQERFFLELDKAERAIAAGNPGDGEAAMDRALSAAYRGGAETDLPVKCFGEQTTRRWLAMRFDLYRLQARQAAGDRIRAAQLFTAADAGGSTAVVTLVSDSGQRASDFKGALRTLEGYAEQVRNDRDYGAFILPEEEKIATAFRKARDSLREVAQQRHRAALDAEDRAFNRSPTAQEIAAAESVASTEMLARAVAGVEVDATTQREAMLTGMRVGESQRFLRDARDWNLEQTADVPALPSSQRARMRGDAMLAQANDTRHGLEARDDFYAAALWYYEFGEFDEPARTAQRQRAAIQPALQAERERREQQMERAAADMEKKAAAVQQAVDEMQKSEAEKKSFNEEADALEAELGF